MGETREGNPDKWAAARVDLGVAYWESRVGDRTQNLERAIAAFKDALSVWTRERNPEEWATARMNLDIAYRELVGERSGKPGTMATITVDRPPKQVEPRLAGDRSEHRATTAIDHALSGWMREGNPNKWADARVELGIADHEGLHERLENRGTIAPVAAQDIKVIGLVSSAHFMSHFFQIVLPPIFPLLKDAFGVGYAELSIVMTLMYATSGLMQTPAGILVDRLGPAPVLIGGLGLYSAAVLLFGFAPNLWVLAALAVVAGLGNCVFHPSDYAILSARVAATRLGRAYGVHNLGGSLGWAAAPIAVLTLTSLFGWRVGLSILGGLGLLLTLYLDSQAAARSEEHTSELQSR